MSPEQAVIDAAEKLVSRFFALYPGPNKELFALVLELEEALYQRFATNSQWATVEGWSEDGA